MKQIIEKNVIIRLKLNVPSNATFCPAGIRDFRATINDKIVTWHLGICLGVKKPCGNAKILRP